MGTPGSRCGRIVGEAQRLGKFIVGAAPKTSINRSIDPTVEKISGLIGSTKGVPLDCSVDLKGLTERDPYPHHHSEFVMEQRSSPLMRLIFLVLAVALGGAGCEQSTDATVEEIATAIKQTGRMPDLITLRQQFATGEMSSEQMVAIYLQRIELLDRKGPTLRSVIAVNPDAMNQAKASDDRRRANAELGPLDGIPVLIKDNIETLDPIPTTAGSSALLNNYSQQDSPIVARLREAGAVILGKTNLSQWANFRSTHSVSGWSSVGGQVKNPHILDRSPCGSSSGSGAAIAAGLATMALGTETNGSIICPAHVNGIVGFKPTVGLLSTEGIVPISASQDTAGPMTKTVTDAIKMMDVLTNSNRFSEAQARSAEDLRIGVLRFAQGENPHIIPLFDQSLAALEEAGVTLVDITEFELSDPNYWQNELAVLEIEFAELLDKFFAQRRERLSVFSLASLIEFNLENSDIELSLFGQEHLISSSERPGVDSPDHRVALNTIQSASRQNGIDRLLLESEVDFLVAPSGPLSPPIDLINGDVWPAWVGAGYMAAIAGYPHLTLPMGEIRGLPVGLSVIGAANKDADVLIGGLAIEQILGLAPIPGFLASAGHHPKIQPAIEGGK
jgi:amidase